MQGWLILEEIDLSYCDQITDEGLRHLRNIQSLNLSDCRGIRVNLSWEPENDQSLRVFSNH
jgi:hypothetical protein